MSVVVLSGRRFDMTYRLDTSTGAVVKRVVPDAARERTAGIGHRCGRRFVAVYVDERGELVLQVGPRRFPIDGQTRVDSHQRLGGLISRLRIERIGERSIVLRQVLLGAVIQELLDPAYDALDRSVDDFLADVADIVHSDERRVWFTQVTQREPVSGD